MPLSRAALKLGLQLVQTKLGQAMGVPGFSVFPTEQPNQSEQTHRLKPATTARIQPPKIVTTR